MGIKTTIQDGRGSGNELSVDHNNSLSITDTGLPPENINVTLKPFAEFLVDINGSEDMQVVASLTNYTDFYIQSTESGDRFVHTLAFTIADASASLGEFGNTSNPLTNGCQLIYQDSELGDVIIADSLKTNFDFVQLCNFEPTFGTGSAAFLASNVQGASEAYIPILDIEDVFGIKHGIRLPRNSTKKLILRIRDTTTAVDRFDVKAFGFDRVKHAKDS